MELSGLIFVALALVWAVVLIPKALRHHDELAETQSVAEVSRSRRVLSRRDAHRRTNGAGDEPEVAPAEPARATPIEPVTAAQVRARRAASAAAARRRRRILGFLLVLTAGVGVVSVAGLLQPWAGAVPGALVLAFLVVARVTVRREQARWRARLAAGRERSADPADQRDVVSPDGAEAAGPDGSGTGGAAEAAREPDMAPSVPSQPTGPRNEQGLALVSGADDTTTMAAVPAGGSTSARLWDPLPVTLPTYVTKPRATRSVRTIDLGAPGVTSSGRDAGADAMVAEAATSSGREDPGSRAVAT